MTSDVVIHAPCIATMANKIYASVSVKIIVEKLVGISVIIPVAFTYERYCLNCLLRVPRNASDTVVYGELGQYPLGLFILLQSAKYFDHMANGNNSLLKEALVSEFQLYCRGFPSLVWHSWSHSLKPCVSSGHVGPSVVEVGPSQVV